MKVLIAGLGSIGRRHLRNLQSLNETEIVLLRSGRSTLPDAELAGLLTEHDLYEALEHHQPDAIIVSNPTAYHTPLLPHSAALRGDPFYHLTTYISNQFCRAPVLPRLERLEFIHR